MPDNYHPYDFIKEFPFELLDDLLWRYQIDVDRNRVIFLLMGDTDWNSLLNVFKTYVMIVTIDEDSGDVSFLPEVTLQEEMKIMTKLSEFSVACIKNDIELDAALLNIIFSMRYDESVSIVEILRTTVDAIQVVRTLSIVERMFNDKRSE